MKRILIMLLLLTNGLALLAQQDQFIEILRQESAELLQLEQEISYYRNLVLKKASIKDLYQENNLALIKQNLDEDLGLLEQEIQNRQIDSAKLKLGELDLVYGEIAELADRLLYYRAKLANLQNNPRKARIHLEKIRADYPQSEIMNLVVKMLGEIYFYSGYNQRILDLYQEYSQWIDFDVAYKLAQANYNLGKIETAKQLFSNLTNSAEHGFRSKLMLGLIAYQQEGVDVALQHFVQLRGQADPKQEYYDFVVLTLARIYSELGDQARSLAHYNLYDELNANQISPDILFEMGNVHLSAENPQQAIFYFNELSQKYPESEYYVSAKFQLAIAKQTEEDFSVVEDNFQELLARNELVTSALNQKYSLLEAYRKAVADLYSEEHSEAEEQALRGRVNELDAALLKTNDIIRNLYGSLDLESQYLLEILEEEYKSYVSTLLNIDAITTLAKNATSSQIENNIDTSLAYSDSTEMVLEMMRLVGHRKSFTEEEYMVVKNIVSERLREKQQLQNWNRLEVLARTEDDSLLLRQVQLYQSMLRDDLRALDIVAETVLGGAPPTEMLALIDAELAGINRNREDLHSLKNEVTENFNQRIVEKLSGRKQTMEQEFAEINQLYSGAYSDLEEQINSKREDYEITYLDLLFKQTQIADQEYNKYQEKIRNEQ